MLHFCSAYSIFNENFRELPGTLNADRLDRDIRAGQFWVGISLLTLLAHTVNFSILVVSCCMYVKCTKEKLKNMQMFSSVFVVRHCKIFLWFRLRWMGYWWTNFPLFMYMDYTKNCLPRNASVAVSLTPAFRCWQGFVFFSPACFS